MSVQTQIDRISDAVSAAKAALTEKGVTVPDGTKVDGLAALIAAIESGGGGQYSVYGTVTPTDTETITIEHNLNKRPIVWGAIKADPKSGESQEMAMSVFVRNNSNGNFTSTVHAKGAYYNYYGGGGYGETSMNFLDTETSSDVIAKYNDTMYTNKRFLKFIPSETAANRKIKVGTTYHWYVFGVD